MKKAKQKQKQEHTSATIKQVEPKIRFKIVYESVYKNIDFTIDEWGLLHRLIYSAPTYKPTSQKLANLLKISIKRVNQASKGLQDKGYLIIKKFGKNSEWIINQEPQINEIKDLKKETLINALLNYTIDLKDLNRLHKLKYIDDRLYIEVSESYAKEIIRIAHINTYED